MKNIFLSFTILLLCAVACESGPTVAPATSTPVARVSAIQHVIIIGFDNTHWQDDLQKMPHLRAFISSGALLRNDHTGLVSHTATGFVSIIAGQYADKTGVLNNTFFDGGKPATWGFWENETDAGHRLVTTPAPWLAFNQAGFDVGVVGWGDLVLENEREVSKYTQLSANSSKASDYLGFALFHKDGTRAFGSPNINWLYQAVGAFPGWSKLDAAYALKATYAMQAHGIPVTLTYIENAHDSLARGAYDSVLAAADRAFDDFFKNLAALGITPANTLFVFTTDEEDYYVEGGVNSLSLPAWLADNPTFSVPTNEVNAAGDASLLAYLKDEAKLPRALEALKDLPGWEAITTKSAMKLLHMASSADPDRVPSFVLFSKPDVSYTPYSDPNRVGGTKAMQRNPRLLWNHGTLAPEIAQIWLAMVGPGIARVEVASWADHTDVRPTIHYLLKLLRTSDLDGRVLFEILDPAMLPVSMRTSSVEVLRLAEAYKQINAPLGALGQAALKVSTRSALAATTPEGKRLDDLLLQVTAERDALATQMRDMLERALAGQPFDRNEAQQLIQAADALVQRLQP